MRETVTGIKSEEAKNANFLAAAAEMRKLYGDRAQAVFNEAANTPEKKAALKLLAETDVKQFLKLFQQSNTQANTGAADSGETKNSVAVGDASLSYRVNDPGCKEYYNEVRKKEPKKNYSADFQLQMNKAAVANPAKFFGK